MKTYLLLIVFGLVSQATFAQLSWNYLSNTPSEDVRYEDVYFVNDTVGWAVSLNKIIATTSGGQSWVIQKDSIECRNVKFLNDKIGFVGVLDGKNFLKTTDGGNTWTNIANLLPTPQKQICGMSVLNGSNIYATGDFFGPATFFKSTDTGKMWTSEHLDSLAFGLVECKFLDTLHGFVSGQSENNIYDGIILKTDDGGNTWKKVFETNRSDEYCWKLQFLNDSLGYASIESFGDSSFIAKTTDGGNTWNQLLVCDTTVINMEGMGFVNDAVGWVGGYSAGMYQTNDGGNTWSYLNFGGNLNRIFYISPTLLYGAGLSIYRYGNITTGINTLTDTQQPHNTLLPCQPNPFSSNTQMNFIIVKETTNVILRVFNSKGQYIATILKGHYAPGNYSATWDCADCPSGEYIIELGTDQGFLTEKVILAHAN